MSSILRQPDNKMSHVDVVVEAMRAGIPVKAAEDIAFDICPEHKMTTRAKFEREVAKYNAQFQ